MNEHLERAAELMAEATSGFVLEGYGLEALTALVGQGWRIIPPTPAERRGPGYDLLNELGVALIPARAVRYEPDESFVDVALVDLATAARSLRALGYSCTEGARKLERIHTSRSAA